MEGRVRDLSEKGCFVDTGTPLPLGTVATLKITKDTTSFNAHVRVVYSEVRKGMGLLFTSVEGNQRFVLDTWLDSSRESSWLVANRRKSQRLHVQLRVRVSGKTATGSPFEEEACTRTVSAHGALVMITAPLKRGQRLSLLNVRTQSDCECVVAHVGESQGDQVEIGVAFLLPNPKFWHVNFPPVDWTPRHQDAKQAGNKRLVVFA